eukprot:scaffold973_cov399-Prasinococcus_capsulatus_cf.AAC.32
MYVLSTIAIEYHDDTHAARQQRARLGGKRFLGSLAAWTPDSAACAGSDGVSAACHVPEARVRRVLAAVLGACSTKAGAAARLACTLLWRCGALPRAPAARAYHAEAQGRW